MKGWEIVVGIETHTQLLTRSKIFSGASTDFGAPPNTQASAVDLALPGTLPVLNRRAVELAIRFGLAVGGSINRRSVFARKNYFYPDLPKGYQISQYEIPIVLGGTIKFGDKVVRITRAHLEEDAGKSLHEEFRGMTGIDLNRAGTPLLEIVSEPDLRSAQEAVAYAQALHDLVTWNRISNGDMEEGEFRCDANVSVRRAGEQKLGTRCEIKNLNSFLFMEQAIEFEVARQVDVLERGGKIEQETRLYDPDRGETRSMRSKEDAQDYRYFPDPDLLPLVITDLLLEQVKASMPQPREQHRDTFVMVYGLTGTQAAQLTSSNTTSTFALSTLEGAPAARRSDLANWIVGPLAAKLNESKLDPSESRISAGQLRRLAEKVEDGTLSGKMVKDVLDAVWAGEGTVDQIIENRGLKQISDAGTIEKLVDEVLAKNAKQVEDYRAGKDKAFNSLVG
ncbi:MAG TPA: Asp-tRNA(Asn)/Glu-tRNA(Gln) amidotransferase subunit GatB, partial [Burkholderiales bacterium]|nr:Asp-tRNA(Asn)/Glu-tRNA(Gln) amidotransferase subunit GatB [Burkholderiales bacterium]